jgi:hypothetical protein
VVAPCFKAIFRGIRDAIFLDIPHLINSGWRHTDYTLSAECDYRPGADPQIALRPFWKKPPFWFFAITVFFVSYGPTWGGLCAIAPQGVTDLLRQVLAVAIVIGLLKLAAFLGPKAAGLIQQRFIAVARNQELPLSRCATVCRHGTVYIAIYGGLALMLVGVLAVTYYYGLASGDGVCAVKDGSVKACLQFVMCVGIICISRDSI